MCVCTISLCLKTSLKEKLLPYTQWFLIISSSATLSYMTMRFSSTEIRLLNKNSIKVIITKFFLKCFWSAFAPFFRAKKSYLSLKKGFPLSCKDIFHYLSFVTRSYNNGNLRIFKILELNVYEDDTTILSLKFLSKIVFKAHLICTLCTNSAIICWIEISFSTHTDSFHFKLHYRVI